MLQTTFLLINIMGSRNNASGTNLSQCRFLLVDTIYSDSNAL